LVARTIGKANRYERGDGGHRHDDHEETRAVNCREELSPAHAPCGTNRRGGQLGYGPKGGPYPFLYVLVVPHDSLLLSVARAR
jgi:hypothetical protein